MKYTIALDFISKFTPTKATSRYSPKASAIALMATQRYPAPEGVFLIDKLHIIEAAQQCEVPITSIGGGDAIIGISAEEFNARHTNGVYDESFICTHGFAPYSYVPDPKSRQPIKVACCKWCIDGLQPPNPTDVEKAFAGLQSDSPVLEKTGALIIAARQAGITVTPGLNGDIVFSRKKEGVARE